jgi:hypothetical protein
MSDSAGPASTKFTVTPPDAPLTHPDGLGDATAAPARSPRTRRVAAWLAEHWVLLGVLAVALVASLVIRHVVYPGYSWNRDEVTYQWQVSVFRGGELFGSDGGFPELFWPWLSGHNADGFFSQYTLGWPLVMLAFDLVFGTSAGAILLGVTIFVVGAYALTRELTRDRRLAVLSTVLLVASPFFAVQSGVYLGYLFSLGLGALFGASLLAGLRRDDWRLVAVAGALLGYLFLTRPFDAALWGAAIGAYALVVTWGRWRAVLRAGVVAGVAFVPFLALVLAYNRQITGSLTQFPFTAKDPLDTFGFGLRRLMPDTVPTNFTWRESVRGELRNFFYLPQFLFGAWLGVGVAFVGLWLRRRERSTLGLLAIMAAFPVGYAVFWGIRLSSFYAFLSAPLYLLPLYVPICILIATVLLTLWSSHRRALAVVVCGALALTTVPYLFSRLGSNHEISRAQVPWRESGETLPDSSLVFVGSTEFVMHLNPFSRNAPELDGDALYATDRPLEMLSLIAAHPERSPFLQLTSDLELGDAFRHPHPDPPTISLVPLEVVTGRQFAVTARVRATSTDPIVVSLRAGDVITTERLTTRATVGTVYETTWRVGEAGSTTVATGGDGVIALAPGSSRFSVRLATSPRADRPFAGRFRVQRYSYRSVADGSELLVPPRHIRVRHESDELGDRVRVTREVVEFPDFDVAVVPVP